MTEHPPTFAQVWEEYTAENLQSRTELNIPEQFPPADWDEVGYIPPDRRSDNEQYNWSQFYDFWRWLLTNGYIDMDAAPVE